MRTTSKILSFALVVVMMFTCSTTAFAAESVNPVALDGVHPMQVTSGSSGEVAPCKQGDSITFKVGSVGYISNCGNFPKFKIWVTGGSADTQVEIELKDPIGLSYGPFGPLNANGSNYLDKPCAVLIPGGA